MSDDEEKLARKRERDAKKQKPEAVADARPKRPTMKALLRNAATLQHQEFPELRWIVPDILPEGCTILAGRPKIGKSWMGLDVGIAVASGGMFMGRKCEQGDVLYLALEDSDRRIQRRLTKMLGVHKVEWPARLTYVTEWPRMGDGCMEYMQEWIEQANNPRLIIVDIIENVRKITSGREKQYTVDYDTVAPMRKLSAEKQLAIVPLHHQRKADAEDLMDTLSGTLGLGGAADAAIVLGNAKGGGKFLWGKGRDLEEFSYDCSQNGNMRWENLGEKLRADVTPERANILSALGKAGRAMSIAEVTTAVHGVHENVKQLLLGLLAEGLVIRPSTGQYAMPSNQEPLDLGNPNKDPRSPGANVSKII